MGIKPEGCLGWVVIIFSPFIAFAIHGTVSGEALALAIFPLLVGVAMVVSSGIRTRRERLSLPEEIRAQAYHGKLFAPLPSPAAPSELKYYIGKNNKGEVWLNEKGVWISQKAFARASWSIAKEQISIGLGNQYAAPLDYVHHVEWSALSEWQVKDDSDSANYYELRYHDGRYVVIIRPYAPTFGEYDTSVEPRVLDYVRSVGQCPVRLFCDVR